MDSDSESVPVFDPKPYIPTIDAILRVSDLDTISAKRIRNAIQALFNVDLSAHKKALDAAILDCFNAVQSEFEKKAHGEKEKATQAKPKPVKKEVTQQSRSSSPPAKRRPVEADQSQSDAAYAAQLHRDLNFASRGASSARRGVAVKKRGEEKSEKKKVNRQTSFHATQLLSAPLAELLGETELPRPIVVQKVFKYVNDHNLKSPEDGRKIICDDKMRPVFGNSVTYFGINKILSKHLHRKDQTISNEAPKSSTDDNSENHSDS